jgi:TrmH family RNA methyltransferase
MANVGVETLRLVAPACRVDSAESRKFAHHARPILRTAERFETLQEAVADCTLVVGTCARQRLRGAVPSWTLPETVDELARAPRGRVALVFGNELNGLATEEIEACHACVRLETPGPYPSYNLSHAVAILLYNLATARAPVPADRRAGATQAELRQLANAWLSLLDASGYFRRTTRTRFAPKLARMLGRMRLSRVDVNTLRGMLAQLARGGTDAGN